MQTLHNLMLQLDTYHPPANFMTLHYSKILLVEAGSPFPHLSHSDDGEIIFNWVVGKRRLEASIDASLHLVWVYCDGHNVIHGRDLDLTASPLEVFLEDLHKFREGLLLVPLILSNGF